MNLQTVKRAPCGIPIVPLLNVDTEFLDTGCLVLFVGTPQYTKHSRPPPRTLIPFTSTALTDIYLYTIETRIMAYSHGNGTDTGTGTRKR